MKGNRPDSCAPLASTDVSERSAVSGQETRFSKRDLGRLGKFLSAHRQAAGMTLRSLATRSGVSLGTIRALEAGRSNPSLATVLAVVEVLGVSLDRMMAALRSEEADTAVVIRAGGGEAGFPRVLRGAVLRPQFLELPGKDLDQLIDAEARHPAFGMVLSGRVTPLRAEGSSLRLESGDAWHAEAGTVRAWDGAGSGSAHLFHVMDTRNDDSRNAP
jgi:transcriptional regulator with XRE-family HTH domain